MVKKRLGIARSCKQKHKIPRRLRTTRGRTMTPAIRRTTDDVRGAARSVIG